MKEKKKTILVGSVICVAVIIAIAGIVYSWKSKQQEKTLNTPEGVINMYIDYINNKEYDQIYNIITPCNMSKDDMVKEYEEIYGKMNLLNISNSNMSKEKIGKDTINVKCDTTVNSSYGEFSYENKFEIKKQEDNKYYIQWDYSLIYPSLQAGDTIDIEREYAKRGSLIDRKGVLLAGTGYVESVGLVPGWMNEETKAQDIKKVAELLGLTVEAVNKKLNASYVKSNTYVELATISKQKLTALDQLGEIDGVKIKNIESRVYPLAEKAAHLTGYVQKANSEDLKQGSKYDENSLIGRAGLESAYNDRLSGEDGYKVVLMNSDGDEKTTLINKEKVDGESIKLTIDSDIQEEVFNQYSGDNSAEVVMDYKTGEILALVSTPSYDPNKFIIGMTSAEWKKISESSDKPLYARFLKSYAPGSSFKPIVGAIALDTKTITAEEEYETSGKSWQKDESWGSYFITTLKQYKEPANLLNALINSDNIFFAKTSLKIGVDKMEEELKKIGFENNIDFPMNLTKSQISNNGKFSGEIQLADSGYGQGQILINPIHFASMYSAIANDGNMVLPCLEYNNNDEIIYYRESAFSKETADELKKDMIQTIENANGTAHSAKIDGTTIAGKTGTAETKSNKGEDAKELGWFNAFIVDKEEHYLIISMVEDVENKGGSSYVVKKVRDFLAK